MDCAVARVTRIHPVVLDGELGRFFYALSSAYRDRARVWTRRAGGADRGIHLATAPAAQTNEMGANLAFGRAPAGNDSNRRRFSLEFSLAAALPSRARNLRRGSAARATKLAHWFHHSPGIDRRNNSDVDLRPGW